ACTRPGCPNLSDGGPCSEHVHARDQRRGSAASRGYNANWRRLRLMVLAREPLCRECKAEGRITEATDVDHILERNKGGTDELSNLRPLCHSCHSRRTLRDSVRGGGIQSLQHHSLG